MAHATQTQTASRPRDRQPMPPPAHPFIHQQCQSATPLPGPLQDHSPRRPANAGGRLYGPPSPTVNPPLQKPKAQPPTPQITNPLTANPNRVTLAPRFDRGCGSSRRRLLGRSGPAGDGQIRLRRRRSTVSPCASPRRRTASARRSGRALRSLRPARQEGCRSRRRETAPPGSGDRASAKAAIRAIRRSRVRCLRAIRKPISCSR